MRTVSPSAARRLRAFAVVTAAVCLLLAVSGAALAESPSPSATPASDASGIVTYRVGFLEPVDSLNPFVGAMSTAYQVYGLNYDTLVGWDPVNLAPRPEFAESWTTSDGRRTWTFKTHSGMTWQDGEPATARDVAFTYNYIIDNQMSAYSLYAKGIKKVTALDETTVRFECSKPKADMLQGSVPILPEHIWSKVSPEDAALSFRNGPPSIGSGPFQVVENKPGIYTKLVANEDYWAGKPHIDELFFQTYENADTMVQDLKSGTIDAAVGVPGAQFEQLGAVEGITVNAGTFWSASQISLNCYDSPDSKGNPVLLDQRFRQALQWAVDRERLVEVAFSGHAYVGQAMLVPYFDYGWEPTPDQAYSFDPEKAGSLLEAAGYKDVNGDGNRETKDGKELTLRLYAPSIDAPYVSAAKLLVGQFQDVGIHVRMEAMEEGALTERIWGYSGDTFTPDYDMYTWYWLGGSDPTFILDLFTPKQIGGWSDTSWTDPAYTALSAQQSTLVDEQARIEAVQKMQQIVLEGSPWIVYGYPQLLEAYNTGEWEGYVPAPSGFEGYAGAVLQNPDQIDTYLSLQPKTAGATETSGSRSWIIIVVIVVVVAAAIVVWLLLRGRGKAVEEG